jgi:hypothetical protein
MPQCEGFNRDGTRCRNEALPGQRSCHITAHDENRITLRRRLAEFLRSHPIVTGLGFVAAILGIIAFCLLISANQQNTTSGTLSPDGTAAARYISFGGPRFEEKNRDGIVAKDGDDPILTVRMRFFRSARCLWLWNCKRQMLVSTKLKNLKGDLVAEVRNNEWSHQPRPAIFDRNYTDSILEIRDATTGRVSLQLKDLGETVYIAGTFLCSHSGWTYTITPGPIMELRPPGAAISQVIPPVCEYPSALHLGQCSSNKAESLIKPDSPVYPVWTPLQVCRDFAVQENRKAQQ